MEKNYLCDAYKKQLCERTATLFSGEKIKIYKLEEDLFAILNKGIGEDVWQYLIVGEWKAMLIDTGNQTEEWVEQVQFLAKGKEIIVVNTHSGKSHIAGNFIFSKVYCHEKEYEKYQRKEGMIPLQDHYIFEIGSSHHIELIWMPGHSQGHCVFLDIENKRLFAGDAVNSREIYSGNGANADQTIYAYYQGIKKLCNRILEIEYIFPGHNVLYLEGCVLEDILVTAESVLKENNNKKDREYIPDFTVLKYNHMEE